MSDRSSPVNGGYEASNLEPAMRLTVRKDLFPEVRLPKLSPDGTDDATTDDDTDTISCVKLETDFEQSIDEIANQKQVANGALQSARSRHKKHKQHSRRDSKQSTLNGSLPSERKRRKRTHDSHHKSSHSTKVRSKVKGGKNLNLVSSSECKEDVWEAEDDEESESSDDEVLKCSVKLPLRNLPRQSGKPYSHELSQLSTKKSKRDSKVRRTHTITPCSGKPRSMLDICSSSSKKKSKKSESTATYRSQIVDMNTIKIKIKRTSVHETITPTPTSIADLGQRKSKKKRAASPVASVSSGEEYDPRVDNNASMSVAAPKPRQPRPKTPKKTKAPKTRSSTNSKKKSNKTERTSRNSAAENKDTGPQSPWAASMPEEILSKIFDYVVSSQGTLPSVIRLGRVCKLWHNVSCRAELWKHVDLAQFTTDKCKTDYKLVWLLENRLSQCQSLNISQWKVCNVSWVLACVAEYCANLVELSVAGWSRITPEQLFELVQGLPKLQRLDLSLTSETCGSSTCLSAASMARLAENYGERFTHLTLANNKFTALPQILSSVAAHCVNLEVLDISGALATSHPASIPLEALQKGCPKLRVFRAANSQLVLASATTSQQMEAGGWTQLEELSIAGEAATERMGVGEYRFGDEALARLVRAATRLRLLDLRGLQRLSDSGLVRVPAWELQHLFLGGCNVTRQKNACLELICEKWSHSLIELDLSWASATRVLDDAVTALALTNSKLRTLNLCGSSVSLEPVKKVLLKCPHIESINLSSCRALPRGMKRLYTGKELQDLKDSFDPEKAKTKENEEKEQMKKEAQKTEADSKAETLTDETPKQEASDTSINNLESSSQDKSSSDVFQEPKVISELGHKQESTNISAKSSPDSKSDFTCSKDTSDTMSFAQGKNRGNATPKLLSPMSQLRPDSSSTPRSEQAKMDMGSPHFSPVAKPDSQVQNSPSEAPESIKNSSWSLGQFKTTPTHKSEASPLNRTESHNIMKHSHSQNKIIEQCSPTTSLENKPSPETMGVKQDMKTSWNYGSPMTRQDAQFSSQRSPYSAQPSPAQPSPYSTQPSPYSTQPSPYSSQPSPYSAQPSPDTSQIIKPDLQKTGAWNTGNFSPMPKHHAPFSPHPSTHTSPDPGLGVKSDIRSNPSKTPGGYSPMSRQDRHHHSPYSPRPSVENAYSNKKSPGVAGGYSPMMRSDCHLPSPDGGQPARQGLGGRTADAFGRTVAKAPEMMQNSVPADMATAWGMDRFGQLSSAAVASIESLVWGASFAEPAPARVDAAPAMLTTPPAQAWGALPPFPGTRRGPAPAPADLPDPWSLGQFRVEPPHQLQHTFVEQNVSFDSLSGHSLAGFLDDGFSESSRVD